MNKIRKLFHRIFRIITFRKGIYGSYGKGCKFKEHIFVDEQTNIGCYNFIGKYTTITASSIGNYCSIAPFVTIGPGEHDINQISTSSVFLRAMNIEEKLVVEDVKIGSDVWIGSNAVILRGVTIGNGAVIAAGAVVNKNVDDYAIVGGVPARLIRYRFNEQKRRRLISTKWWEKNPSEISQLLEGKVE